MAGIGWRIVVSAGHTWLASGTSSKPTTDRSSGIGETQAVRHREHAGGHFVVAREDRSRALCDRHLQELARALDTRIVGVVALRDQFLVERHAALAQAVAIALVAIRDRRVIRIADDEADARVAEPAELLGHLRAALAIVRVDAATIVGVLRRRDAHERHVLLLQQRLQRSHVRQRRRHDHAVRARLPQIARHFFGQRGDL